MLKKEHLRKKMLKYLVPKAQLHPLLTMLNLRVLQLKICRNEIKIPSKYLESDAQIFRWDFPPFHHYFIFNLILIPQGSIRPCKRSVSIIRIRTRSIIFPFSGTVLIKSLIVQPFLIHNNQRRLRILRRCFRRIF